MPDWEWWARRPLLAINPVSEVYPALVWRQGRRLITGVM